MRAILSLFVSLGVASASWAGAEVPEQTVEELSAGFAAKVLASAVFVSGREVDEALANSVYPFVIQGGRRPEELTAIEVDREAGEVRVTFGGKVTRTAKYFGDQGCVLLPKGEKDVFFTPVKVESRLPDAETQAWPMGDVLPKGAPVGVDLKKLKAAGDFIFRPENFSVAFVVVHQGRIVAERYGEGAGKHRRSESWSMGKSLTAMLYGILVKEKGRFDPFVPAGFAAWQGEGDARSKIQIADLFRMSSGLKFSSQGDPRSTWDHPHPDHNLVYTGAIDVFAFSLSRPAEHPPNTVGRYRNCDPLLIGYLIKRTVEGRGENYLAWPQRALFDKLGIRHITLEPDPYGNFVMTGFEYGAARDWARLGMLMVQDGVWEGERLLPEGFVEFVSSPAPAWEPPAYGGLFWVNATGRMNLPKSAYYMAGHGGQHVFIVPSHELVIVRMGHLRGGGKIGGAMDEALTLIVEAVE
jgi:CubicO group peptidase (beta-lactamase class C family)